MEAGSPDISTGRKGRKPKKGNFSHAYKGPENGGGGLDWDAIRQANQNRVLEEMERGVDSPETRLWRDHGLVDMTPQKRQEFLDAHAQRKAGARKLQGSSLTPEERAKGGRSGGARVDVPRIVELYVEHKMTVASIAQEMGHAVETIRHHLKKRKVYEPYRDRQGWQGDPSNRHQGPHPQRETCALGHDLTLEGATKQLWKKNASGQMVKNGRVCTRCWGHA